MRVALEASVSSERLQAALTAGTRPAPEYVDVLVERCAIEPDFYVRDMLTWALTRHDVSTTVDRLLIELDAPGPQARSQALHTLSKVGDKKAWPAIIGELLRDGDKNGRLVDRRAVRRSDPRCGGRGRTDGVLLRNGRARSPKSAGTTRERYYVDPTGDAIGSFLAR